MKQKIEDFFIPNSLTKISYKTADLIRDIKEDLVFDKLIYIKSLPFYKVYECGKDSKKLTTINVKLQEDVSYVELLDKTEKYVLGLVCKDRVYNCFLTLAGKHKDNNLNFSDLTTSDPTYLVEVLPYLNKIFNYLKLNYPEIF